MSNTDNAPTSRPPRLRRRPDFQVKAERSIHFQLSNIPPEMFQVMCEQARKRDVKINALVRRIVITVLRDNLFDAVLDDQREH